MTFPLAGCKRYVCRRREDGGIQHHWLAGPPLPREFHDGDFLNYVSCAEQSKWEQLGRSAHAAQHRTLEAAKLYDRKVGEAFVEFVIRDPKVRACVEWLSLEFPVFRPLLSDDKFPSPHTHSRFGPPLIFDSDKWPVVLDSQKLLGEIARVAGFEDRMPAGPDDTNSLFHAAQTIAHQHKAFFNLLCGDELSASGTSEAPFSVQPIQNDQWTRPDRYLDVKLDDLLTLEDPRLLRKICTGIKLRSAARAAIEDACARHENGLPPPPPSPPVYPKSELYQDIEAAFSSPAVASPGREIASPVSPMPAAHSLKATVRRRRPKMDLVAQALKEEGLDRSYGSLTAKQIAEKIAHRMPKPPKTQNEYEAFEKLIRRYKSLHS